MAGSVGLHQFASTVAAHNADDANDATAATWNQAIAAAAFGAEFPLLLLRGERRRFDPLGDHLRQRCADGLLPIFRQMLPKLLQRKRMAQEC